MKIMQKKLIKGKKTVLLISLLVLVLSLSACSAGGEAKPESVTLTLGHALPEGTDASDLLNEFAENVKDKTEGRVVFDVFGNSKLGSESEMMEQLDIGSLESAAIMVGSMQSVDMRMAIEDLPYMWKNVSYARSAYDGEFGDYLADIMKEYNLEKIGYLEWGLRHITNNRNPIVNPEDMEGIKIRVAQTKLRVDAFEEIGALPTIMAFSELYGALQQGAVDAQENPLSTIAAANLNEVQDYLSLTGHFYNTVMVVVEEDSWSSISEEDQNIVLEEMAVTSNKVREANDNAQEKYLGILEDRGMQINDNVDTEAFRNAMLPVYEEWEETEFGEELMNVYREASGW